MPELSDTPPASVAKDLMDLSQALDKEIPAKKTNKNLLIATWNIRKFGSLTRKWTAASNDEPKRDLRALRAISEVISRFDVVAVQEVTGDLRSLRDMIKFLGDRWAFLMTDVTKGKEGNNERMAFIYDTKRLHLSGLACELVVPEEWLKEIGADALRKQFARTPYAVSFRAGQTTFILVTLHVDYGSDPKERIPELKAIARWIADWADQANRWHHNLLTMGDFNIDRHGDDLWKAFISTGLTVPDDLQQVPRSIFVDVKKPLEKYYDQIAWFKGEGKRKLSMKYLQGKGFDFLPYVYTETNLTKASISHRMSDHYPLWVEFQLE